MKKVALFLLAASLYAEKPRAPKAQVAVPDRFHNEPVASGSIADDKWWSEFRDPLLNELVERVAAVNLDARRAAARVAEARAIAGERRSALLPSLDASTSVNQVRTNINPTGANALETSLLSGAVQSRWELDVFGGLKKQLSASKADADAAAQALADVIRIARSDVARNYIELRGYDDQIAIVRRQADSEKEFLDLIRARADAGLATQLDVERQQTQLSQTRATLPELEALRLQAAHRIAVLLGEEPGALVARFERADRTLTVPELPDAIPSDVLRRRPDLRRADAEIAAAFARVGAARADLYPRFSFSAQSGRQGVNLAGLALGVGNFFSVGPSISLPIFEGGRIKSQIAARDAQLEQAMRAYEQEVLAAFEETENALVARERYTQRERELATASASARQSVELSRELYLQGLNDYLTVLDAQREEFRADRDVAAARTAVLRSTVALHRALGD